MCWRVDQDDINYAPLICSSYPIHKQTLTSIPNLVQDFEINPFKIHLYVFNVWNSLQQASTHLYKIIQCCTNRACNPVPACITSTTSLLRGLKLITLQSRLVITTSVMLWMGLDLVCSGIISIIKHMLTDNTLDDLIWLNNALGSKPRRLVCWTWWNMHRNFDIWPAEGKWPQWPGLAGQSSLRVFHFFTPPAFPNPSMERWHIACQYPACPAVPETSRSTNPDSWYTECKQTTGKPTYHWHSMNSFSTLSKPLITQEIWELSHNCSQSRKKATNRMCTAVRADCARIIECFNMCSDGPISHRFTHCECLLLFDSVCSGEVVWWCCERLGSYNINLSVLTREQVSSQQPPTWWAYFAREVWKQTALTCCSSVSLHVLMLSRFSRMRPSLLERGMTTIPRWVFHLSRTCAKRMWNSFLKITWLTDFCSTLVVWNGESTLKNNRLLVFCHLVWLVCLHLF